MAREKTLILKVKEADFEALRRLVNRYGEKPDELFSHMIHALVAQRTEDKLRTDPFLASYASAHEARMWQQQMEYIREVGMRLAAHPSEELTEEFYSLCYTMGLEPDEVLEGLPSNELIQKFADEVGNMNPAERWLLDNMPAEGIVPVSTIRDACAAAIGCHVETVNSAKRKLGIKSKKIGTAWFWHFPWEGDEEKDSEDTAELLLED